MSLIARLIGFMVLFHFWGNALCQHDEDDNTTQLMTLDEIIARSIALGVYNAGGELENLAEGILVEELDIIHTAGDESDNDDVKAKIDRYARKADRSQSRRWPQGIIPYYIQVDGFDAGEKELIQTAMGIWNEHTCLRFRPYTSNDYNALVFRQGSGCSSSIGMVRGQSLILGSPCRKLHAILHETGHAIGLHHEHNRPDRDNYVWVRWSEMKRQNRYNYDKKSEGTINTYGMEYDYSSVMHYGENYFKDPNREWGPVMIASDPAWQFRMGMANNLSFWDIKIVNLMYNCNDHCGPKTCPEEGFLDKHCECKCPGDPVRNCNEPKVERESCYDIIDYCEEYRRVGRCWEVHNWCGKTCKFCGPNCRDKQSDCLSRARRGDCKKHIADWMFDHCPKSCGICWGLPSDGTCLDEEATCADRASQGDCTRRQDYMKLHCKRSCAWC